MARKDIGIANFNLLNLPGQPIYAGDGWTQARTPRSAPTA